MNVKAVLAAAVLTCGLAVTPAAAFDFPGCGDFELVARTAVTLELSSNTLITGDILVLDPTVGKVRVGNGNDIKGTVVAHAIELGQGSVVAVCSADVVTGAGKCLVTLPFTPPSGCLNQPFPPGVVVPQIPLVCSPNTALVLTADTTLDPGCYASLNIKNGVKVTLQSGEFYAIKGNIQTGVGVTIQSSTPGSPATLFTGGVTTVANNATLRDLRLFQLGAAAVLNLFNGSVLDDTLVVSTSRLIHIHTGSTLHNSALAAPQLDVQPIITSHDVTPPVCTCPAGSHPISTPVECVAD